MAFVNGSPDLSEYPEIEEDASSTISLDQTQFQVNCFYAIVCFLLLLYVCRDCEIVTVNSRFSVCVGLFKKKKKSKKT